MLWWGLILVFSTGALLGVGIALYLRVRHHMKKAGPSESTEKD